MNDLIKALTIFAKYQTPTRWPTICCHDELIIVGVMSDDVSAEDRAQLESLDFRWDSVGEYWSSYRFGSA